MGPVMVFGKTHMRGGTAAELRILMKFVISFFFFVTCLRVVNAGVWLHAYFGV